VQNWPSEAVLRMPITGIAFCCAPEGTGRVNRRPAQQKYQLAASHA